MIFTVKTKELGNHLQKEVECTLGEEYIFRAYQSRQGEDFTYQIDANLVLQDEVDYQYKFIPYQKFVKTGGGALSIAYYTTMFDSSFPAIT